MPETAGENYVFLILFAIFAFVIITVFAYFLLFGFGFTNAASCYTSSQIRNFFFNDLCVSQYFCISGSLSSMGIVPPLMGCTPLTQSYSSGSTEYQVFSGVQGGLSACWHQYGGEQQLSVLPNNPGLCGVININLPMNMTFYNLTKYLNSTAFTSQVSCLNHTAQQACPNYQLGYSCDTQSPQVCIAQSSNYFKCQYQQGYSSVLQGYSIENIELNSTKFASTAANNMTNSQLCAPQNCVFNRTIDACTNISTGAIDNCRQLFTNFCKYTHNNIRMDNQYPNGQYNCTVEVGNGEVLPPPSCTLTEPVNRNSTVSVSYYKYLEPGTDLLYSWKNKTSGASTLVEPYSNKSINKAQLYIEFLNSFSKTRSPPKIINLPSQECAPASWLNNYPNAAIQYECTRALITVGAASLRPSRGIIGVSALTGISLGLLSHYCANQPCSEKINTGVNSEIGGLFTATGLSQCTSAIFTSIASFTSTVTGHPPDFLGRDEMYLCAVVS